MTNSMTAFSQNELNFTWGHISWEIRSLNQRYLDISIDLPKNLYELSWKIRKKIKNTLFRGKIECSLQINMNNEKSDDFFINKDLISSLIFHTRWIKEKINTGELDPMRLLCYPGVLVQKNKNTHYIHNDILTAFENTLNQLVHNRKKEGLLLKEEIIKRLLNISKEINDIQQIIPNAIKRKREKLLNYIHNSYIETNSTRLEQELFITIQKIDISEEIDRLIIHVTAMNDLLKQDGPIGKKLDFIAQELQREANTITAKSIDINITHASISLKVFIDQIREQIQNIE